MRRTAQVKPPPRGDLLYDYARKFNNGAQLTHEEEAALSARIQAGDRRALNTLINANLRLVISFARRYENYGVDFDDLVQEGNLGLMRAAEKYDASRGARFATFATWWIRSHVWRALARDRTTVKQGAHRVSNIGRIFRSVGTGLKINGEYLTVEQIAALTGFEVEKVNDLIRHRVLMENFISAAGDEESGGLRLENLADTDSPSPEELATEENFLMRLEAVLQEIVDRAQTPEKQNQRRRDIDAFLNHFVDGRTLEEIGHAYGVSRQRIEQREVRTRRLLREPVARFILGLERRRDEHPEGGGEKWPGL